MTSSKLVADLREIYDMYRTAALNKAYYGARLASYQRLNTGLEVAIAIGATSSGVSGLAIINGTPYGKLVWGVITGISGLLAVAKPILQINKKVERYSKLFTGHQDNFVALHSLIKRIRRRQALTPDMIQEFELAEQRFLELSRDDEPNPVRKVRLACEQEVRTSIPDSVLWMPRRGTVRQRIRKTPKLASVPAAAE